MSLVYRIAGNDLLVEGATAVAGRQFLSNIPAVAGSGDCVLSTVKIVTGNST